MKGRNALVAAAVMWLVILAGGQSLASEDPAKELLVATPDHMDTGTVAEGKKIEVTTTIQNVGTSEVRITNVRTS